MPRYTLCPYYKDENKKSISCEDAIRRFDALNSKTNNIAPNLEWCTRKYNNQYGTKPMRGERHPMAKLSAKQVAEIREKRKSGILLKDIALDYGISMSHACGITRGLWWNNE